MHALAMGTAGLAILLVVIIGAISGAAFSSHSSATDACTPANPHAPAPKVADIPAIYLDLYVKAGRQYGIPWLVLAAIGAVESDHGRSQQPGIRSGETPSHTAGPMQFQYATWQAFGVDGNRDGRTDPYNLADAIPSAARYLKHNGAPTKMRTALYRYNPSWTYVDNVLGRARQYTKGTQSTRPDECAPASGAMLAPGPAVSKIIAFAMAQRGKRYVLGANGPDAWDCSSLVQGAYRAAGYAIPRTTFEQWPFGARVPKGTERPGDLVFFNSGPGTSRNRPGHVGLVIAPGKMVAARCSTCKPNIGVQSYKRRDWMGVTRPLLRGSKPH